MTPAINLLIDAHGFDDHYQGSRTYISGLYRALITKASQIHFYFAAYDTTSLQRELGSHANVSFVNFKSRSNLYRLAFDIPRLIKRHSIDVAHFQYAVPFIKTCKEIVTIHDVLFLDYPQYFPFFYRLIRKLIFKWSAHRANLLLTVSNHARQSIAKNFKVSPEKILVIPNGIDQSFLKAAEVTRETNSRHILYVSRWEPRKNHILLLKAFQELSLYRSGYKLIFVGKKDIATQEFDVYWETLKEEERNSILFFDSVSQQELIGLYQHSSLFIYPSLAEGFGIPPIEAASLGIPVLCSNATAMADFTFFGEGLFDPGDKEELKQKIVKMLSARKEKSEQEIRAHVLQAYDWDTIAFDYLQLINKHIING